MANDLTNDIKKWATVTPNEKSSPQTEVSPEDIIRNNRTKLAASIDEFYQVFITRVEPQVKTSFMRDFGMLKSSLQNIVFDPNPKSHAATYTNRLSNLCVAYTIDFDDVKALLLKSVEKLFPANKYITRAHLEAAEYVSENQSHQSSDNHTFKEALKEMMSNNQPLSMSDKQIDNKIDHLVHLQEKFGEKKLKPIEKTKCHYEVEKLCKDLGLNKHQIQEVESEFKSLAKGVPSGRH